MPPAKHTENTRFSGLSGRFCGSRLDVAPKPREPVPADDDVVLSVEGHPGMLGTVADGDGPNGPVRAAGQRCALGRCLIDATGVGAARLRVDELAGAIDAVLSASR